jgi:hypothetical protein
MLCLVATALVPSTGLAQKGKSRDDAARYGWQDSLTGAMKEAKRVGKPVMVVFRCVP